MLDIKFIRENRDKVLERLNARNTDYTELVDKAIELDAKRRAIIIENEELKAKQNAVNKSIPALKKEGKDLAPVFEELKAIANKIKEDDKLQSEVDAELEAVLLSIPNIPDDSVPVGKDSEDNVEIRRFGKPTEFDFEPKPHWELGEKLGILDLARGAKLTGSGFPVYAGAGARLQRALIQFMLDFHVERHGYREVYPPFLVSRETMTGTGQLPKFEEDLYRIESDDLFLIPTAEVPVTNLHREEILADPDLPLNYVAYTPCFRREAGSYGKETRGITRVRQFDKVEMVKLVRPEDSFAELEALVRDAEEILQALGLHYRVVEICTGDLGFSNCKQYDLEVWAAGMGRYLEVSSCSNFTDFQARRANIRFRREPKAKPEFVHTLNGSGLALPRTMIAILEHFQTREGKVQVPEAVRERMGMDMIG